jgi:hypothetical protein
MDDEDSEIPVAFYPLWVKLCLPFAMMEIGFSVFWIMNDLRIPTVMMFLISAAATWACLTYRSQYRYLVREEASKNGFDPEKIRFW